MLKIIVIVVVMTHEHMNSNNHISLGTEKVSSYGCVYIIIHKNNNILNHFQMLISFNIFFECLYCRPMTSDGKHKSPEICNNRIE